MGGGRGRAHERTSPRAYERIKIVLSYIAKRLFSLVPTLIGITIVTFFIMKLVPGDPVMMRLMFANPNLSPDQLSAYIKSDEPPIQLSQGYQKFAVNVSHGIYGNDDFLNQKTYKVIVWVGENTKHYLKWFTHVARFDFGRSVKDHRPVIRKILECLPITIIINLIAVILIYAIAVPLGIWSARRKGTLWDRIVLIKLLIWYALPSFWVASLLLMYLAGGEYLNLFPIIGLASENHANLSFFSQLLDYAWHLILPVFVTVVGGLAYLTRFSRNNFLEVLSQDYMRTARAKGLPERTVIYKHGLRNALIPFVTLVGMLIPGLLGGSVIVEQIFNIHGMGMLSFEAVLGRDQNVIMAIATLGAFVTLLGLLISDLLYRCVDPRVRLE